MKYLMRWLMLGRMIATIALMSFGMWVASEAMIHDHFIALCVVIMISLGIIWGADIKIRGEDDSENKSD